MYIFTAAAADAPRERSSVSPHFNLNYRHRVFMHSPVLITGRLGVCHKFADSFYSLSFSARTGFPDLFCAKNVTANQEIVIANRARCACVHRGARGFLEGK